MTTRSARSRRHRTHEVDPRSRERQIVAATRALFDERGAQSASIEEIARAVGLARGLMYRHFSSKEELFVLTTADYLREVDELLRVATQGDDGAEQKLRSLTIAYAGYCLRYPAHLDSSTSLMQRGAVELRALVSESVWLQLGQSMGSCLDQVAEVIRQGVDEGVFVSEDPDYAANLLWTQVIGAMHLARLGVGVRLEGPNVPGLFKVDPDAIVDSCVESALALVRA
ncbi:TetR/AcrR family transcriptional regulator [soil metagenome]